MKRNGLFQKATALLLSVLLLFSLCATALAAEDGGTSEEIVCTGVEGCPAETHKEGCPSYEAPPAGGDPENQQYLDTTNQPEQTPAACDQTSTCPAQTHEDTCLVALIAQLPEAGKVTQENAEAVTALLASINAAGVELTEEQKTKCSEVEASLAQLAGEKDEDPTETSKPTETSEPAEPAPEEVLQQMIDALEEKLSALDPQTDAGVQAANGAVEEIYAYAEANGLELTEEQNVAVLTLLEPFYPKNTLNEDDVASVNGTGYSTVESAIEAAGSGDTVLLLKEAEVGALTISKNITIDLGGRTLKLTGEEQCGLTVENATVRITNGAVDDTRISENTISNKIAIYVSGGGVLSTDNVTVISYCPGVSTDAYNYPLRVANGGEMVLNGGTVVKDAYVGGQQYETYGCVGVTILGSGSKLTIDGAKIETKGYAVSGNGTSHGTEITITGKSELISDSQAIYHPQNGVLNVKSGTITGVTGIEMRAGTLNVTGGTIVGTGKPVHVEPNGNGSTSDGAGIAIAQHTTKLPIVVNISSGNISGYSALYESNPENNSENDLEQIQIRVSGGDFQAINDGTAAVYSQDKEDFIYGGTFNSDVTDYVIEGNKAIESTDGVFTIGINSETAVAEFDGVGYTTLQAAINAAATAGGEVKLLKDTQENIVIPAGADITLNLTEGVTLTNASGHTITNNGMLTLTGSGTVDNVTNGRAALYNNGTCIVEDGTLTRSKEAGVAPDNGGGNSWYVIYNSKDGDLTINGGTVMSTGKFSSLVDNNNKLTITDGSFSNGMIVIKNEETGTLDISGGSFVATYYDEKNDAVSAVQNWGTASISNGSFTSKGVAVYASEWDRNSTLTITGGTFTGGFAGIYVASDSDTKSTTGNNVTVTIAYAVVSGNPYAIYVADPEEGETNQEVSVSITYGTFNGELCTWAPEGSDDDTKIVVSGGTFSNAVPEEYCADDFHPNEIKNADGTVSYGVHQHEGTWTVDHPDCTKEGSKTRTCTICNEVEKEEIPVSEHDWDTTYTVDVPATCTTKGKESIHCKNCDVTKDERDIPVTDHTYSTDWTSDANNHWHACKDCDAKQDEKAHTFAWVVDEAATVSQKGSKHEECTVCGYKKAAVEIPKLVNWESLELDVKADRTSVRPGRTVTYTLTVTNDTGYDLTDIVVAGKAGKNLTFSKSSGSGSYASKDGLWTIPYLKDGRSAKITLRFTVDSSAKDGTTLSYAASLTDAEAETGDTLPQSMDITASTTVKVSNKASLIPSTGDTSHIFLWTVILVVALAALIALGVVFVVKFRKKK